MNNSEYEEKIWMNTVFDCGAWDLRLYLSNEQSWVESGICICQECESKRPHLASGTVVTIWGAEGSGGGGEERLKESPDTWGGNPLYQYIILDFIWIVPPGIERCQRRYKRSPSLDLSLPHPHLPQCHNRPTFYNEVNEPGRKIPEKQKQNNFTKKKN